MTNLYEIEWSNQAIHNFEEIVGYLSNSWNEKVVKDFVRSVDRAVTHITMFPYAFPATSLQTGGKALRVIGYQYNLLCRKKGYYQYSGYR